MATKKKATKEAGPQCSQCKKSVKDKSLLDDCIECGQVVDACNDCIEDHMAEEHPEDE